MGLELTTDKYPPITSQTRYPLRHAASWATLFKFSYVVMWFTYFLFEYSCWYVRINKHVGDKNMFISFFKNRLTEYMTQTCYADLTSSSICDTDYSFKSLFEMEYLSF